ncbi:MAG: hypothetical protein JSS02_34970 [Planctomycetes bacterium]|nr:hypothetical protein [Planctomycetota bacterium]
MPILQLDPDTTERLEALAAASGMTVDAYLRLLLPTLSNGTHAKVSPGELDELLVENSFEGLTLPADFSRADIYDEHT